MTRFKLTLEYDGSGFVGWQRQDNGPSVQQALEEAIFKFCGETVDTYAAGRTDAGVHARGQVVHVDLARQTTADQVRDAVNFHLKPAPVSVLRAEIAAVDFATGEVALTTAEGPPAAFVGLAVSPDGSTVVATTQLTGRLLAFAAKASGPLAPISELDPDYREVRTGLLEMSGTNSTQEMMTMIETTRAFEANVRVIQNHDTMSTNLISRVLQG